MGKTCGTMLPSWDHRFAEATACLLPDYHNGPHHAVLASGQTIEFLQPDPECDCDDCLNWTDPMDACVSWSAITQEQDTTDAK